MDPDREAALTLAIADAESKLDTAIRLRGDAQVDQPTAEQVIDTLSERLVALYHDLHALRSTRSKILGAAPDAPEP
jgi:hypothetical protein